MVEKPVGYHTSTAASPIIGFVLSEATVFHNKKVLVLFMPVITVLMFVSNPRVLQKHYLKWSLLCWPPKCFCMGKNNLFYFTIFSFFIKGIKSLLSNILELLCIYFHRYIKTLTHM